MAPQVNSIPVFAVEEVGDGELSVNGIGTSMAPFSQCQPPPSSVVSFYSLVRIFSPHLIKRSLSIPSADPSQESVVRSVFLSCAYSLVSGPFSSPMPTPVLSWSLFFPCSNSPASLVSFPLPWLLLCISDPFFLPMATPLCRSSLFRTLPICVGGPFPLMPPHLSQ